MGLFAGTQWDVPAHCDRCGILAADCQCQPPPPTIMPPEQQTLRVRVEKRKAGRFVTVISGLEQPDAASAALAHVKLARAELLTRLKNTCGAGGCQEGSNLVLQGDQKLRATKLLTELGYRLSG